MTYTTQFHTQKSTSGSRIAAITLLALILIGIQSSSANAQWTSNGNNINNTNTGNVGVGTTSPATALEVGRNAAGTPTGVTITGGSTVAAPILYFNYADAGSNLKRWLTFGDINGAFNIATQPDAGGPANTKLFISNGGNVGIGTTTPGTINGVTFSTVGLHVKGSGGSKYIAVDDSTNVGVVLNDSSQSPNNRMWAIFNQSSRFSVTAFSDAGAPTEYVSVLRNGNVGIGTSTPATKLELAPNTAIKLGNAYLSSGGDYLHLANNEWYNGTSWVATAAGALIQISGQDVNFYRHDASGGHTQSMSINSSGNIGIGTTTPSTKLHVAGSITVDGNINAKYQDVAEWVPSTHALPAGTVVTLDPTKSNHVEASSLAYDTRVAGVISVQPGIALGEKGDNKVLVATTGRVRVKVDATRAPIRIGDLLVTGDTSGVAMKSEPIRIGGRQMHSPGTLIGKALEPLEKGRGEILVLLSLQ
jgi:hypothetical protein